MNIIENRYISLDWLRGLMAISVMLYHYSGQHDSSTPLGRLGIYAVSIFFILSGLSIAIAYDQYICDVRSSVIFFIRRLFRIWPLLWLAIALVSIPSHIFGKGQFGGEPSSINEVLFNLFTLIIFNNDYRWINVGAWSIGNEVIFYLATPFIVWCYKINKNFGNILVVLSFLTSYYFAFYILNPDIILATQFATYTQPANNFIYFILGFAIYYNINSIHFKSIFSVPFMALLIIIFFFYPASGDQIKIVTGGNWIVMAFTSTFIVIAFYKFPPKFNENISRFLSTIGIATYGIYLLHPIVAWYLSNLYDIIEFTLNTGRIKYIRTFTSILTTIFLSILTFKYIELPMIKLGKRVT